MRTQFTYVSTMFYYYYFHNKLYLWHLACLPCPIESNLFRHCSFESSTMANISCFIAPPVIAAVGEKLPSQLLASHMSSSPKICTLFMLGCFVVVWLYLISPISLGLLLWHWGNFKIAPVPAKQYWRIWINDLYGSINSLWPSDVIWRRGFRSTLAQVMACCLTAPSHYLNQCWLIISKV